MLLNSAQFWGCHGHLTVAGFAYSAGALQHLLPEPAPYTGADNHNLRYPNLKIPDAAAASTAPCLQSAGTCACSNVEV